MNELMLGVNIDHIATLRNARGTIYPDPIQAAFIAEQSGADTITFHLREDRRHITDRDIKILKQTVNAKINMEMAITEEMLNIACDIRPDFCCFVPEKRQELTTEGGLDIINQYEIINNAYHILNNNNIQVSLFIDTDLKYIKAAASIGVPYIEIHTGHYANARNDISQKQELKKIIQAVKYASSLGLKVNAGHGLNYHNVQSVAKLTEIYELNIGHSIISRAVINGLKEAISEMKYLMIIARK